MWTEIARGAAEPAFPAPPHPPDSAAATVSAAAIEILCPCMQPDVQRGGLVRRRVPAQEAELPNNPGSPEIAREITTCWISAVPSKMS